MNKFGWTGIILSLMLAVVQAGSCSSSENLAVVRSVDLPTPTPISIPPSTLSSAKILTLQKFAEGFEPKSGHVVIPSPPIPNQEISEIIARAANSASREHEKFVVLIFLRLSRFQAENFKQRYELGRTNPLTREFYRLIGRSNFETAEINLAYLADLHVEQNPDLLKYKLIDAEMKRIAKAGERIERELADTSNKAK